jgi:hypothetical protein
MIKHIGKISKVHKIELRLHKKLTMRGLYYRRLVNKIYNTQNKKTVKQDNNIKQVYETTKKHLGEKGFFIDKSY